MSAMQAATEAANALDNWQRDPSPENFARVCWASGKLAGVALELERALERELEKETKT